MTRVLAALAAASVLAAIVVAVVLIAGGGDDNDVGSADEVAQKVAEAIREPGMVYNVGGNDGSLAWIDAEMQQYRRRDSAINGGATSVGSGWTEISYDAATNAVTADDTTPSASQRPRIDDPMVRWMDPLAALAFSNQLTLIGRTTADGKQVIALEATTPVVDGAGNVTGTLYGRVEVDAETYLPYAFEARQTLANGATPTPGPEGLDPRVLYTSEFIERSTLPADFFERSVVEGQIETNQNQMEQVRELGLTPVWFGQYYDGKPYGELQLPPTVSVSVNDEGTEAEIRYALVSPTSVAIDAVIIRLAADASRFTRPEIPQFAGDLPEDEETVTLADGVTATLYTSILTIDALPCPSGGCPQSSAALYRRLVLQRGDTAVQIEVSPRILADGTDSNGFNSRDGIVSLAGVLVDVPADIGAP
jgi:hypothetical protein